MSIDETNFKEWASLTKAPVDASGLFKAERKLRRAAFSNLFEKVRQFAPDKSQAMFYDGYAPDVSFRRALIIPYSQRDGQAGAYRVIVSDETTHDANITEFLLHSREWAIRPVGRLITLKECLLHKGETGTWQIQPDAFYIQRRAESAETRVWHGTGYSSELPTDSTTYTTPLELLDRRIAAEQLAGLLATLPVNDGEKTNYKFGLTTD